MTATGSSPSVRACWMADLIGLLLLTAAGSVSFLLTDLDLFLAGLFYVPEAANPWPYQEWLGWRFFYYAAPWITGILAVVAIVAMIRGRLAPDRHPHLARYGLFIFLSVALGPGLVVNALLKDHWGRPRPRQVEALGGRRPHLPLLAKGASGVGKSFPCGHSSVGFVYCVFYFLWRRRRPRLAFAALAGSLALGSLMGVGRMAAGGHFASDVLWSASLPFAVCWALYYFGLRIPHHEDCPASARRPVRHPRLLAAGAVALIVPVGFVLLLATPVHKDLEYHVRRDSLPAGLRAVRLDLDRANVTIRAAADADTLFRLEGTVRGFGLPTNEIVRDGETITGPPPTVTYLLKQRGVYTELDSELVVHLCPDDLETLEVRVREGDIIVDQPERFPAAVRDLKTASGEVVTR